jgi:hypothetical protein
MFQATRPFPSRLDELQSVDPDRRAPYWFGANRLDLHLRRLVLAVSRSGWCHGKRFTLLSCSCRTRSESVRRDPLSDQARASLAVDLRRGSTRRNRRAEAHLRLRSSGSEHRRPRTSISFSRRHRRDRPTSGRSREPPQAHSAIGPLRRMPTRAHAAIRATLRPHADRPGLPLPARLVSRICQPCFMLVRPWAPSLQRFLPARAARPSRALLSSLPFVSRNVRRSVRSTRCTSRCRGFEDFSHQRTSRLAASGLAASGCVHQGRRCSRLPWVAPLLVVFPLRG